MTDLCLAFDPSSSMSKAIYSLKSSSVEWLAMEPEVIELSRETISHYEANRIGESSPENQSWIEMQGNYYAVGYLARKRFYSERALREVKYKRAVYKVVAMVGAIATKKKLASRFNLSLGILLPYGEYKNRGEFRTMVAEALESFSFRGRKYQVKLEEFDCQPEGAGVMLRGRETGVPLKETDVLVVMVGYRNASYLLMERGQLSRGETTKLGFVRMLEVVKESTSGLEEEETICAISRAGKRVKQSALVGLVEAQDPQKQKASLIHLANAVRVARTQYWEMLVNWIEGQKFPSTSEVILAGGTAYYYQKEMESLLAGTKINWGENLEKQIIKLVGQKDWLARWSYRLTDVYGYFFYLQYLFTSVMSGTKQAV
jgi:hypothetical protein